ncbi:MAG: hypothetical protein QOK35_3277, partial [Pseudonocardiales bacterium]|nr:hypothetical protein [Pseudonocardiales bacterium]
EVEARLHELGDAEPTGAHALREKP